MGCRYYTAIWQSPSGKFLGECYGDHVIIPEGEIIEALTESIEKVGLIAENMKALLVRLREEKAEGLDLRMSSSNEKEKVEIFCECIMVPTELEECDIHNIIVGCGWKCTDCGANIKIREHHGEKKEIGYNDRRNRYKRTG